MNGNTNTVGQSIDYFDSSWVAVSQPLDAATRETSFYWEETTPEGLPPGTERGGITHQCGLNEPKRQRRDSHSTLKVASDYNTANQQAVLKLRVTKSLGPESRTESQISSLSTVVSTQYPPTSSSFTAPSLTWSGDSHYRCGYAPEGDDLETTASVSFQRSPAGSNSTAGRNPECITEPTFDLPAGEVVISPLLKEWAGSGAVSHHTGAAAPGIRSPNHEGEDSYSVATSDEEDMAKLLDTVSARATQMPPSSVIRSMDSGSFREVFDPNLPGSSPEKLTDKPTLDDAQVGEEDLLDSKVDWDEIIELLPSRPHDPSLSVSPKEVAPRQIPRPQNSDVLEVTPERKPFVRPPFPALLRDKSPIAGLSSSTVIRTCFRIGQLLNETKKCFGAHQETVFEFYARVTYSSREKMARVQHFQFMDLFKEHLPYPTGTLNGWKTGSLIDEQSLVFLGCGDGPKAKLCRCICKPTKEKKRDLGWSFSVLTIRQVDWEEIEMMKRMMCGVRPGF